MQRYSIVNVLIIVINTISFYNTIVKELIMVMKMRNKILSTLNPR